MTLVTITMTHKPLDVGAALIKLKPHAQDAVATWREALNERMDEAVATLKAEGVYIESWFQVHIEGQDYLIAYMRAEDIKQAQKIAKNSAFPIDHLHQAFKNYWERAYPAELLVDLVNDSDL